MVEEWTNALPLEVLYESLQEAHSQGRSNDCEASPYRKWKIWGIVMNAVVSLFERCSITRETIFKISLYITTADAPACENWSCIT